MRLLLDEDIPLKLRHYFRGDLQVETVQYRGWRGLENGELLRAAERDFDVLVTLDDQLPDRQNLRLFAISVVILRPRGQALEEIAELVPELERRLPNLRPGEATRIYPPDLHSP